MTDAGARPNLCAGASVSERERVLRRIAETLEVSLADLSETAVRVGSAEPSAAECSDLLAAFHRIPDPDLRRRCLGLVRAFGAA
ncbi:hypothetical protein [Methylobacterium oxalidis]|uniref:hypothetical protein n=1 Tax=Methylobacterium oxalidis TaxID=944322 RepID=UPI003315D5B1